MHGMSLNAQNSTEEADSLGLDAQLQEVQVVAPSSGSMRMSGAINGFVLNKNELFKAACCNLGENLTPKL